MKQNILYPKSNIFWRTLKINNLLALLLIVNYSTFKFLILKYYRIRTNFPKAFKTVSKIKLYKYYITGGVIGYLSISAIKTKLSFYKKIKYCDMVSNWAIFTIILDGVSDIEKSDNEYSLKLNILCSKLIFKEILEKNDTYRFVFEESLLNIISMSSSEEKSISIQTPLSQISLFLAEKINQKVQLILHNKYETQIVGVIKVIKDLSILCKSQIDSFNQKYSNDKYNWKWYCEKVLKNKTTYIFSLIYLFAENKEEDEKANRLINALLLVNDLFLNRQLLDDMNDIEIDCMDRIFTTPSYLLSVNYKIKSFDESNLYGYIASQIKKRIDSVELLSKQADIFHEQFTNFPEKATQTLLNSNVPKFIIQIIEDEKRYLPKYFEMKSHLAKYLDVIPLSNLFYYRCSKSLLKAKKSVQEFHSYNLNFDIQA